MQLSAPSEPIGAASTALLAEPPRAFRLRDGTGVRVRPICPEDRDRLREGLHRLSAASRYHRFLAAVSELSEEQLRYLTEVDQVNHLAWIALDPALPEEPAVGVARYIRISENPGMAVVAVTVLDAYQGRGLGTVLLGLLSSASLDDRHGVLQKRHATPRVWPVKNPARHPPSSCLHGCGAARSL